MHVERGMSAGKVAVVLMASGRHGVTAWVVLIRHNGVTTVLQRCYNGVTSRHHDERLSKAGAKVRNYFEMCKFWCKKGDFLT